MLRNVLLCLDSDPHCSVFDAIVAVDAGVEVLLRHSGVKPADVRNLVYGCIFTRGVENLKHTAIFVGGSDVAAGEALVKAATDAFFGPMRVSVMLDSNGSNTTAAAAVCAARRHVDLRGALVTVLAGTGAVGRRVVALLASEGAQVRVGSRKRVHAEATCHKVNGVLPNAELRPWKTDSPEAAVEAVQGAQIVIACGAAGAELLPAGALGQCPGLQVAIDLNAVPPAGIADLNPNDKAVQRDGVLCYGALGVGGTKMKIHKAAVARLFASNALVLDAPEIYALGRELDHSAMHRFRVPLAVSVLRRPMRWSPTLAKPVAHEPSVHRIISMPKRPSRDRSPNSVAVERTGSSQGWVLRHPPCVRKCAEDLDEVRSMINAGETALAIDELRWLLEVCRDLIEAHALLGRLAVESEQDLTLARAHFGYGYQLGVKALDRAGNPTPLSALHPANRPFFDAGRGLAWCLNELAKPEMALEVVERLLVCDPSDPLGLASWVDEIKTGGKPIVELGGI